VGVKPKIYILSDTDVQGARKLPVIRQRFFKIEKDPQYYDYLLFTSKNGVRALLRSMQGPFPKVLAIGKATAKEAENAQMEIAFVSKESYSEKMCEELCGFLPAGSRILYVRGKRTLFDTASALRECKAEVDEVVGYETVCVECDSLRAPEPGSVIVFSSPSTVRCFFSCFKWKKDYKAVALGKKTASYIPAGIEVHLSPGRTFKECLEYIENIYF